MVLHWRPVGPEPEQTYWQRRAVVAVAVLLPLVLLAALLTGGDDAPDTVAQATATPVPSAEPTADASTSASPEASPTPTVTPCGPDALGVTAQAVEDSYRVGAEPRLELAIANTSAAPCTVDVGQAAVELLVFSGSDRIWSSDDCAPGGDPKVVTLSPGKTDVSRVTWPGVRSAPGCKGSKAQAEPGTYRVTGRVGERQVRGQPFVIRG